MYVVPPVECIQYLIIVDIPVLDHCCVPILIIMKLKVLYHSTFNYQEQSLNLKYDQRSILIPEILSTVLSTIHAQPALIKLWVSPSTALEFLKTLVLCAYSSFLFGWHVHEKAVMIIILPMW